MIHFVFPFDFQGQKYSAGCHVIPPPPDTQYHITPHDEELKPLFGYPVKFVMRKAWEFSYPSTVETNHPEGPIFIQSLADGLFEYLKKNPQYLIER